MKTPHFGFQANTFEVSFFMHFQLVKQDAYNGVSVGYSELQLRVNLGKWREITRKINVYFN